MGVGEVVMPPIYNMCKVKKDVFLLDKRDKVKIRSN